MAKKPVMEAEGALWSATAGALCIEGMVKQMADKGMKAPKRGEFGDNGIAIERVIRGAGQHLLVAMSTIDWEDERESVRMVADVRNRLTTTVRMLDEWLGGRQDSR